MSAIRPTPKSHHKLSEDALFTLPDGRRLTYDTIMDDARRQRSQAIGLFVRAIFAVGKMTPVTTSVVSPQHEITGHRHA